MQSPRILFVVTSADYMGAKPTGSWLEEVAAPYYTFLDAKCDVTLASPKGGNAPIDATSLEAENTTAATRRFDADAKAVAALSATARLETLSPADYDAIFFAGGHGTMADFPIDASVRTAVEAFYAAGKPLASVCHGPACLVSAHKPSGAPLVEGHRFTCFSDAEETAVGLAGTVPFMLETRLTEQGGSSDIAPPFKAKIVIDGPLITGQNPASAIPVAEAVIHALRVKNPVQKAA